MAPVRVTYLLLLFKQLIAFIPRMTISVMLSACHVPCADMLAASAFLLSMVLPIANHILQDFAH